MSSPVQRVANLLGLRKPEGDAGPPQDERTLLQVMLGNLIVAVIAAGLYALFGGDLVESIAFGALIYVLFLYLDLRTRRKQREDGPPPAA